MHTHAGAKLGQTPPTSLVDTRLQLHWAAQIIAAVGDALVPHQSDDSHTNLEWRADLQLLVGNALPDDRRVGLQLETMHLLIVSQSGEVLQDIALPGQTLQEGLGKIGSVLNASLSVSGDDISEHPVQSGVPFSLDDAAPFEELARWFASADGALRKLLLSHAGDPVRCWPHHFDIATLLRVAREDKDDKGDKGERIVGVGLSLGDKFYAEPYWYVSPWQLPDEPGKSDLPNLPAGGFWRPEGWFGAVLTATQLLVNTNRQAAQDAFLASAVEASIALVHAA